MKINQQLIFPRLSGIFLIIIGFISFVISYFFLPLFVTALNCFDSCTSPHNGTTWDASLRLLSGLSFFPLFIFLLVLCYLPLITIFILFGDSIIFYFKPRIAYVKWFNRSWWIGIIPLIIMLPFLFFFILPQIGYLGMLVGFVLLRIGFCLLSKQSKSSA